MDRILKEIKSLRIYDRDEKSVEFPVMQPAINAFVGSPDCR
jgi:hypothetical protein